MTIAVDGEVTSLARGRSSGVSSSISICTSAKLTSSEILKPAFL